MRKLKISDLNRLGVAEYKTVDKMPLVVVMDDVRSMYNVGSVFRTADAYKVESIYLCGITSTPPHAEIHKTALGAEDSVDWRYYERTEDAVSDLKNRGYKVICIEQVEGSIMLQDFFVDETAREYKYAVIMGNEVKGVKQSVVDMCDGCIELPQYGTKHSLNVSITAGIVIWEFAKHFII